MNLVSGLALNEFSVAQVDRAPTWCLGGHRFDSCWGLISFFAQRLWHTDYFRFHKIKPTITTLWLTSLCRVPKMGKSKVIWRVFKWVHERKTSFQLSPRYLDVFPNFWFTMLISFPGEHDDIRLKPGTWCGVMENSLLELIGKVLMTWIEQVLWIVHMWMRIVQVLIWIV